MRALAATPLTPFRSLREPDRRRRDEERPSRSELKIRNKPKRLLDSKSPIRVRKGDRFGLHRGVGYNPFENGRWSPAPISMRDRVADAHRMLSGVTGAHR
jgi:hypothetical protein